MPSISAHAIANPGTRSDTPQSDCRSEAVKQPSANAKSTELPPRRRTHATPCSSCAGAIGGAVAAATIAPRSARASFGGGDTAVGPAIWPSAAANTATMPRHTLTTIRCTPTG